MTNLEKARIRLQQEKARVYQLSKCDRADLLLDNITSNIRILYEALSPEDRAILMAEESSYWAQEQEKQ